MRTLAQASIFTLGLLLGCAHRAPGANVDPVAVVAQSRATPQPFALRGAFSVAIRRGDATVSTRGALVLHAPDQFRVEVMGPVGTPLIIVASDGRNLNVWSAQTGVFYRGADAPAALRELTGGALQLSDVVRVLTGQLPLPDAPVLGQSVDEQGVAVSLQGPEGATVGAHLDPKTAVLAELSVQREGEPLVQLDYLKAVKVGRSRLPGGFSLDVPALDMSVFIKMESWDELGQIPEVFSLSAPANASTVDLVEALKEAALKRGEAPASRPQP